MRPKTYKGMRLKCVKPCHILKLNEIYTCVDFYKSQSARDYVVYLEGSKGDVKYYRKRFINMGILEPPKIPRMVIHNGKFSQEDADHEL